MSSSEWSLVLFTLFSQISVGIVICTAISLIVSFASFSKSSSNFLLIPLIVSLVLMILALISSFVHLSAPLSSFYSLSNLKSSWLSREILMVSFFSALVFVTVLLWKKIKKSLEIGMLLIVSLAGVLLIYTMAKIYIIPTVPPWNTPFTIAKFFISVCILGPSLFIALIHLFNSKSEGLEINKHANILLFLLMIAAAGKVVLSLMQQHDFSSEMAAFMPNPISYVWTFSSWFFLLMGMLFFLQKFLLKRLFTRYSSIFYAIGFLSFLLSELASRVIFYSMYYRVGL